MIRSPRKWLLIALRTACTLALAAPLLCLGGCDDPKQPNKVFGVNGGPVSNDATKAQQELPK